MRNSVGISAKCCDKHFAIFFFQQSKRSAGMSFWCQTACDLNYAGFCTSAKLPTCMIGMNITFQY